MHIISFWDYFYYLLTIPAACALNNMSPISGNIPVFYYYIYKITTTLIFPATTT